MNTPMYAPEIQLGRDIWRNPGRVGGQILTQSGDGRYSEKKVLKKKKNHYDDRSDQRQKTNLQASNRRELDVSLTYVLQ